MTLNARFNLKCYMSHGLLADSVDTSLASLLITHEVLSEVHDQ